MENLYTVLGVEETASSTEIKKRYRSKVKKCHPDRVKGKEEEFKALSRAYSILRDEKKRKLYDDTGETESTPVKVLAMKSLALLFSSILKQSGDNLFKIDIKDLMQTHIQNTQRDFKRDLRKNKKLLKLYIEYKDLIIYIKEHKRIF